MPFVGQHQWTNWFHDDALFDDTFFRGVMFIPIPTQLISENVPIQHTEDDRELYDKNF